MRVAVTGANGFVGRFLIAALGRRAIGTVPLVRRTRGLACEVAIGDIASLEVPPAIPPVDIVVHLAARTTDSDRSGAQALAAFRDANVNGTRHILECARAAGARRFIFMSSIKVNGEETSSGKPFQVDDAPCPLDAYGVSKWEAEQAVIAFCESHRIDWTIVRAPLVYGPGVGGNFKQLVRLALSGLPLPLASADNRRSLIYVENLADFLVQCAVAQSAKGQIFLPSDGEPISTAALLRRIALAGSKPVRLFSFPPALLGFVAAAIGRKGIHRRLFGDLEVNSEPSAALLDWRPPFSLDQSLRRTISDDV